MKRAQSTDVEALDCVRQEHSRDLNLPYEQAFRACGSALDNMALREVQSDESSGAITAKTKMTWKSFGEIIDIRIIGLNENKTRIEVQSRPLLRTTMVDYGKNLENIEKILTSISANVQRIGA